MQHMYTNNNDFDFQHSSISSQQTLTNKMEETSRTNKKKKQIKRQRKDPNEPQKPVSPYALFFRDKQNEIKKKLSNPSFGEISKVVAHMWENIGPEIKEQYKRQAAAAKKEYLKQLATYRAVQISHQIPNMPSHHYQSLYPAPSMQSYSHFSYLNLYSHEHPNTNYQQYNFIRPTMENENFAHKYPHGFNMEKQDEYSTLISNPNESHFHWNSRISANIEW